MKLPPLSSPGFPDSGLDQLQRAFANLPPPPPRPRKRVPAPRQSVIVDTGAG